MISIASEGEGRDLVLLPGWAMHRGMWGDLPARLGKYSRVHVCEQREAASLEAAVEFLAAASAERVDVLGWSLGGIVAMSWALRHPRQVERLVLIGSTPCFVNRGHWQEGNPPEALRGFEVAFKKDEVALIQGFLQHCCAGEQEAEGCAARLAALYAQRDAPSSGVLADGLTWLRDTDLSDSLPRISQSVLLIHGEEDAVTPASASRKMKQHLSNAVLHTVAACGHAPHLTHADEVERIVCSFLYG